MSRTDSFPFRMGLMADRLFPDGQLRVLLRCEYSKWLSQEASPTTRSCASFPGLPTAPDYWQIDSTKRRVRRLRYWRREPRVFTKTLLRRDSLYPPLNEAGRIFGPPDQNAPGVFRPCHSAEIDAIFTMAPPWPRLIASTAQRVAWIAPSRSALIGIIQLSMLASPCGAEAFVPTKNAELSDQHFSQVVMDS